MEKTLQSLAPERPRSPAPKAEDPAAYVGSIPEHYHRGVGPFLFEPYALELSARAAAFAPQKMLETACGTGILTRRLREALPARTQLFATDLHEPMIAEARRTLGQAADVRLEQADMTRLRFHDGEFDALACQFGLMFVADKVGAAREALRVLRRGGRLLVATWRALAHNAPIRLAHETVARLFPGDPPGFYLTQTGFGEPDFMRQLLLGAGFEDIKTEVVAKRTSTLSARGVATGLIQGFPVADFIRARAPEKVALAVDELTAALAARFGNAPMEATVEALVTTATATGT